MNTIFHRPFDEISSDDLAALVEARIPEGRRLEYKRDHYGKNDDARREFAADVSALANAQGGFLLIGVAEENGIAKEIVGVDTPDPDTLTRAVADAIRTSIEPQILGFRVRWINIAANRGVLMIQVDRSWSAPHRVTVGRDSRFFLRDENGKHPMSVNELRHAFLFATEVEERIRQFRFDRLALLAANEGPLAISDGPRLILHLVPQIAFTDGLQISYTSQRPGLCPIGSSGWSLMHSLDGLVTYSGPEERFESVRAFSTLFRDGTVEAVAQVYTGTSDEQRLIDLDGIERGVISALQNAETALIHYSVPPPYYLMISIIGVRGLAAPNNRWRTSLGYPYRSDRILLPEMVVEQSKALQAPSNWLQPPFDLLWNAFGQSGSPNYDQNGQYKGR